MIYSIIIGVIAGWLAGRIMRGGGFGFLINLLLGVAGSLIGSLVLPYLGLHTTGTIGSIISATAGAVLLLVITGALKK